MVFHVLAKVGLKATHFNTLRAFIDTKFYTLIHLASICDGYVSQLWQLCVATTIVIDIVIVTVEDRRRILQLNNGDIYYCHSSDT